MVIFGPDPRLAIGHSGTLLLTFLPGWLPWTDPESADLAPVLIQLGTESTPGACFTLSVSRELDALLLSSPLTPELTFKLDFVSGGKLCLAFGDGFVKVLASVGTNQKLEVTRAFRAGDLKGVPSVLQLGSDSDNLPTAPFCGLIGNLVLFDRSLPSIPEVFLASLKHHQLEDFFAGLGLEKHKDSSPALVGVMRCSDDGTPTFDFNPRQLFWPTGTSVDSWTLRNSTGMPVQVDVPDVESSAHGIYSSFCMYCVVRIDGEPWLHGDEGQRFKLRYLGGDRFHAETSADYRRADGTRGALEATLTLETPDQLSLVPASGWTNAKEKLFPWKSSPSGTSPHGDDNEPMTDDVRWPAEIVFQRTPAHYDMLRGSAEPEKQSQSFKDSFSTRLKQLGMSFRGWNLRAMDHPLNLAMCTGGQRDESMYLFLQPADDSKNYRLEGGVGVPYFCFVSAPEETDGSNSKRIYRSADEYSHDESTSYGANLTAEGTPLVKASFEESAGYKGNSDAEHTIAISQQTTIRYVVVLDKRWLKLAPHFVSEVHEAASRQLNSEGEAGHFDELFRSFGTHYPHAVTYGNRTYSLAVLDEDGLSDLASHGTNLSVALEVPIEEGVTAGGGISRTKKDERGHRATFSEETEFSKSVGTHEQPGPVLIDLRPITEILQPPFLVDETVGRALPQLQAGLERFLADGRSDQLSEGMTLYQVRLVSIRNLDAKSPLFVCGRAFLAGVAVGEDWHVVVPATAKRRRSASLRVWASAQDINAETSAADSAGGVVRIDPGATHTPNPLLWGQCAVIGLPRNRTDLECAIGWTGRSMLVSHESALLATQTVIEEEPDPWRIDAQGSVPTRTVIQATPEVVAAWERSQFSPESVDFFGQDWTIYTHGWPDNPTAYQPTKPEPNSSFYVQGGSAFHVFWDCVKAGDLPEGATFSRKSIVSAGFEVVFEVRKIDPLALYTSAADYKL